MLPLSPYPETEQPTKVTVVHEETPIQETVTVKSKSTVNCCYSRGTFGFLRGSILNVDKEDEVKCLLMLRKTLKSPGALFKSEFQARATLATWTCQDDIVIRLPTGGGKTMCYAIPFLLEGGQTTVVVYPLVALLADQQYGFQRLQVSAIIWKEDLTVQEASGTLLLVHVNQVGSPSFKSLLGALHSQLLLKRIVLEEVHLIKEWSFHLGLQQLMNLRLWDGVQMVMVSATLDSEMVQGLLKTQMIESALYIEAPIAPLNHKLALKKYLYTSQVASAIKEAQERFKKEDRGIIYCMSVNQVVEMHAFLQSQKIDTAVFYGDLALVSKIDNLALWRQGPVTWMIATSAFGLGIDYAQVRQVIVLDSVHQSSDLLQFFGRAGRDGEPAFCTLFIKPGHAPSGPLKELMESKDCLRVLLYKGYDKEPASCLVACPGLPCTYCLGLLSCTETPHVDFYEAGPIRKRIKRCVVPF